MQRNVIDLVGRHAIVTGGAKGLGYAIAQRLVESGASVTLWDADADAVAHAAERLGTFCQQVDVSDETQVAKAASDDLRARGPAQILINNAGIAGPNALLWEYPHDAWKRIIDINLLGVYHCCRAVLPAMMQTGYGRVVNIASIAGKEGNATASAYAASKGGVISLTKSLGKELVNTGVLVNCVAPAAIETEIFKQNSPDFKALLQSKIPMGRLGRPEELAALVAWLSSAECSFNTGAVFDLSGGRATY